jgi:uncharacterized protein (DUF58 family)
MRYRPTRFHVVLLLLTLVLLYAMSTGFTIYYRLSYSLGIALIVTYVWGIISLRGLEVRVQRQLGYREVGGVFVTQISVTNTSTPKPILEISDLTTFPDPPGGQAIGMGTHATHSWTNRVIARRRGVFTIGPIQITATDPFGMFRHHRKFATVQQVVVYPATVPLPLFALPRRGSPGEGTFRRPTASTSPTTSSVRKYMPTDTLGHIHWPTTARTGKLMVKQFDQDAGSNVWIVLDLHKEAQAGMGVESTEEYGVTIAASIARHFLDSGLFVGMFAYGTEPLYVPPSRGYGHEDRIMQSLALVKAEGNSPLAEVLEDGRTHGLDQSSVVIITPSIDPGWPASASWLFHHGAQVTTVLIDPSSFGGTGDIEPVGNRLASGGVRTYSVRQGQPLGDAMAQPMFAPTFTLTSRYKPEVPA